MERILDLRTTNEGVSCADYTLLVIAGPSWKNLPPILQERMSRHLNVCAYHNSRTFHQSAINSFPTPELEVAALEVVQKYSNPDIN